MGVKYYSFPPYNIYYESDICKQNKNYSLCQKWLKVTNSYDELKNKIDTYNNSKINNEENDKNKIIYEKTIIDHIVAFYVKYYYMILIGIIAICVTIMVINTKKNKFDI